MTNDVELTNHNFLHAGIIGVSRQIKGMNKPDRNGGTGINGWQFHIVGACGELAVAKYYNDYWDGALGDFGAADVGKLQVRTTSWRGGDLCLHKYDKDEEAFILVQQHTPTVFRIAGWIYARDGKLEEYWGDKFKTKRPAYWVPESRMRPMNELRQA